MTAEEVRALARKAGADGVEWMAFTFDEEQGETIAALDAAGELTVEEVKGAWLEGRRELREKTWVSVWTTAEESYDFFGTFTAEGPFEWDRRQLRRVLAHPDHAGYQRMRYGSGLRGSWDEDPRVAEARIKAEIAREKAEREERAAKREVGLAWLASLPDSAFADRRSLNDYAEDGALEAELLSHNINWTDHRDEYRRRVEAKAAAERAASWARCRALVPDGATLIDLGTPGVKGYYGWIKGRDPDAWRSVGLLNYGRTDLSPDAVPVIGEGRREIGSLARVAGLIEKGEMRLARPDEHVPPRAVVDRVGRPYTEILRVEVGGVAVWVGEPTFARDPLVLDDAAKLVRKKKVVEAALAAWREHQHAKWGGA